MVNHPNRRKTFKVSALPGSSEAEGETHFAVRGPRVDEFAEMDRIASVMQRALNAPEPLTAIERKAIRTALAFALSGEPDDGWPASLLDAMRGAHAKLS